MSLPLLLPVREAFDLILPNMAEWDELSRVETIEAYWKAQKAVDRLVHSESSFEEIGDILNDLGIDPIEWAETAVDNAEFLISNG